MSRSFAFPTALLVALSLPAQDLTREVRCRTHDPALLQEIFHADPEGLARTAIVNARLEERTRDFARGGGETFVIPVVFHVIHNHGTENISDAQIVDAVRILNEDFNKENPDWPSVRPAFLDLVADVGITFRLAQRDPQGNCTNGITRTVSPLTNEGNFAMTQLVQWPREHYMNVWVGASANGAAGYTNYPWVLDGAPQSDGIVVKSIYVGSIGTGDPGRSRVLTHEVGHWLNLMHCWGNSNEPGTIENCEIDDNVDDTPLTRGWTSCSLNGSSCGSVLDNVENYMEYSYCDKMFTLGQADRMIAALTSPVADRDQLWQPDNLAYTGVLDGPQLCAAGFVASRQQICAGEQVTFSDVSYNQVTQRNWEFPGGEPATSSAVAPQVIYSEPGIYPVSLTVSDGINTLTATESVAVEVLPDPGAGIPFTEGFEDLDQLSSSTWTIVDPDGDGGFNLITDAAASGSASVKLANGPLQVDRTDELISPTFDLSNATEVTLSFRYAFAQRQLSNDDRLGVLVSNNCGDTWSLRQQLLAISTLNTAGSVAGNFSPQAEDWQEAVVTNIGISQQVSRFRFKFQFESGGGNHLYLDDINLNGYPVAIAERSGRVGNISLRPNPARSSAQADILLMADERVSLTLLDMLGRPVSLPETRHFAAGKHTLDLPIANLADGSYLLELRSESFQEVVRFVIGE